MENGIKKTDQWNKELTEMKKKNKEIQEKLKELGISPLNNLEELTDE